MLHRWETQTEPIGLLSQPFKVILEILIESPVVPSHVAVDDIKLVRCYDSKYCFHMYFYIKITNSLLSIVLSFPLQKNSLIIT